MIHRLAASSLRVGVLHDSAPTDAEVEVLERLAAVPGVTIAFAATLVPVKTAGRTAPAPSATAIDPPSAREPAAALRLFGWTSAIGIDLSPSLEQLRSLCPDLLINLSAWPLTGPELELPRLGVWSVFRQSGDILESGPMALWEVREGTPLTQLVLARQRSATQAAPLRSAALRTKTWSARASRDQALRVYRSWLAQLCTELASGEEDPAAQAVALPIRHRTVSAMDRAATLVRTRLAFLRKGLVSATRRDHWTIGLVNRPIESFLTDALTNDVEWLPEGARTRFVADPFALEDDGNTIHVLVEDLDYEDGKGRLSVVDYAGGAFAAPTPVFELTTHLSYPYLLEHEGDVYCIPENRQGREVALYRALDFPMRWEKVTTLIRDRGLVDATPFHRDGRWWMWAGDEEIADNAALVLWFADDLFGPWQEHPMSPVKIDVRSARPAGTPFVHEGRLYRPGQDSSVTYGGRIVLNEVLCMTPSAYLEQAGRAIQPAEHSPYSGGLHTICAVGPLTIIDSKRFARNGLADLVPAVARGVRRTRRLVAARSGGEPGAVAHTRGVDHRDTRA